MQVQLFKKVGKYTDKNDGKEKTFTNFYVKCGDSLIPVEVCYFPQDKFDGRDPNYNGRKQVMSAFAVTLPDKPDGGSSAQATPSQGKPPVPDQPQPVDDTESALSGF
ncbi:MAG: hypothetical protein K2M47_06670 [Clostridiales bacterium]|nr:hypothetical protein [Clostridiales bacterium]